MAQISSSPINFAGLTAPDAYLQIINPPSYITGVPSDVGGVVGSAPWGPVNTPVLMGSLNDLNSNFGPITSSSVTNNYDLPTAATMAFQQAQGSSMQLWGVRVVDGLTYTYGGAPGAGGAAANTTAAYATNNLLDTAGTPATGLNVFGLYFGSLGNQITVAITAGSKPTAGGLTYFNITVNGPPGLGFQPEVYPNIAANVTGGFWSLAANAINNGISGIRGPSKLIYAKLPTTLSVKPPSTQSITLAGGVDGSSNAYIVTAAIGSDSATPKTGLFALRNLKPAIGVAWVAGLGAQGSDSTLFPSVQGFADSEGVTCCLTFPLSTSTATAISTLQTVGIDDPLIVWFKDWQYIFDSVNNTTRLIPPTSVGAGKLITTRPDISPLNKPVYGVIGTERFAPQGNTPYSLTEIGQLNAAGITLISNPCPGGNYFGFRTAVSSSSDAVRAPVEYGRLTNYLARSFAGFIGKFIGLNQSSSSSDPVRNSVRSTFNNYLEFLRVQGQISSYKVICDLTNNTPSTIAQHFLFANILVQYYASVQIFGVSLQGGTTTVTSSNSTGTGLTQ